MPTEFIMLALSIALGLTHVLLGGHAASLQRGYGWATSARDVAAEPLVGIPARLERAMRNYLETFTFFAATVMLAHTVGGRAWMMAAGSQVYFYGRVAYLPLYAFGVPVLRTVVWNVSVLGIVMVLLSIL
jgi:uncharacterized MAPEG superfamily protein